MKYTRELLEPFVKDSKSVAEVLRKLGKRQDGSIAAHVSHVIKKLGIDTSHFLGRGANHGKNHKGGCEKKHWSEVLVVLTKDRRETAFRLRRALIESGREYKCENCGVGDEWFGKELRLCVHHANGEWQDCTISNLAFLCPNCHSQTDGHSGSKGRTKLTLRKDRPGGVIGSRHGPRSRGEKSRVGSSPTQDTIKNGGR